MLDADSGTPLCWRDCKIGSAAATTAAGGLFTLSNLSPGSSFIERECYRLSPYAFSGELMSGATSLQRIQACPAFPRLYGDFVWCCQKHCGHTSEGCLIAVAGLSVLTDAIGHMSLRPFRPSNERVVTG